VTARVKQAQDESMRTTLVIQGARENNLRNISVEFPRNKLVVITGVSSSGKSSLAFDTLYAEGQRRLLASMSAYAKRFVNQLRKPDVDFVHGLSPVISIDQKTVGSNPRSTIGTMTDLWDYLRMLYATALGHPKSLTGAYLRGDKKIEMPGKRRAPNGKPLRVRGARQNNLQNLDVEIPLGVLVCVTGASGSGKSSLVHDIVYKRLASLRYDSRILAGSHDALEGHEAIDDVIDIDQSPIGRSPRSNPATYVGIYDAIRELFAQTDEAKKRGFGPATFSFNVKGGRCEECAGDGAIVTQLSFMPDVEVTCPACKGRRYREETLEVTWQGRNIAEVLKLSIEESVGFFKEQRPIVRKLEVLHELGLGYLELGHAATILSGGEAQRVKLAAELGKMRRGRHNLYILDEPTTGLHLADIQRLLDCLQRLVEAGHSVLVIEHHLDVIKCADWVLDLGPEGGHQGGRLIIAGTPEAVAKCAQSYTGKALREHLKGR
jgi:excinuclease ABC subunit A